MEMPISKMMQDLIEKNKETEVEILQKACLRGARMIERLKTLWFNDANPMETEFKQEFEEWYLKND